jgi:N-methylhydantoinase A
MVKTRQTAQPVGSDDAATARIADRYVYFRQAGGFVATRVFRRERLTAGNVVTGPAVVEAVDTTTLVHPGQTVAVDGFGNLLFVNMGERSS